MIVENGFKTVNNMLGGISKWSGENKPTITAEGASERGLSIEQFNAMINAKDSAVFVYNLANDIREQTNVIDKESNKAALLEQQRKNWLLNTVPPIFLGLNQEEKYNEEQKKKKQE